jgi:hypothetical protein
MVVIYQGFTYWNVFIVGHIMYGKQNKTLTQPYLIIVIKSVFHIISFSIKVAFFSFLFQIEGFDDNPILREVPIPLHT